MRAVLVLPKHFVIEPEFNDLPARVNGDKRRVAEQCRLTAVKSRLYPTFELLATNFGLCGVTSKLVDQREGPSESSQEFLENSHRGGKSLDYDLDYETEAEAREEGGRRLVHLLNIRFPVVKWLRTNEDTYATLVCSPGGQVAASREAARPEIRDYDRETTLEEAVSGESFRRPSGVGWPASETELEGDSVRGGEKVTGGAASEEEKGFSGEKIENLESAPIDDVVESELAASGGCQLGGRRRGKHVTVIGSGRQREQRRENNKDTKENNNNNNKEKTTGSPATNCEQTAEEERQVGAKVRPALGWPTESPNGTKSLPSSTLNIPIFVPPSNHTNGPLASLKRAASSSSSSSSSTATVQTGPVAVAVAVAGKATTTSSKSTTLTTRASLATEGAHDELWQYGAPQGSRPQTRGGASTLVTQARATQPETVSAASLETKTARPKAAATNATRETTKTTTKTTTWANAFRTATRKQDTAKGASSSSSSTLSSSSSSSSYSRSSSNVAPLPLQRRHNNLGLFMLALLISLLLIVLMVLVVVVDGN